MINNGLCKSSGAAVPVRYRWTSAAAVSRRTSPAMTGNAHPLEEQHSVPPCTPHLFLSERFVRRMSAAREAEGHAMLCREKLSEPSTAVMPHFVVERLCLLQATMTCLSGPECTEQLVHACAAPLQQGTPPASLQRNRLALQQDSAAVHTRPCIIATLPRLAHLHA
jgi:hypothetical protein